MGYSEDHIFACENCEFSTQIFLENTRSVLLLHSLCSCLVNESDTPNA